MYVSPLNPDCLDNFAMQLSGDLGPVPGSVGQLYELLQRVKAAVADCDAETYHLTIATSQEETNNFGYSSINATYFPKEQILNAYFPFHQGRALSTIYTVTDGLIEAYIKRGSHLFKKRWAPYLTSDRRVEWALIYNEFPTEPLHVNSGRLPVTSAQLLRELASQLAANRVLGKRMDSLTASEWESQRRLHDVNLYIGALNCWQIGDVDRNPRCFTTAEMDMLFAQAGRIRYAHNCADPASLIRLFEGLDHLTVGDSPKLSELLKAKQSNAGQFARSPVDNRLSRYFRDHFVPEIDGMVMD